MAKYRIELKRSAVKELARIPKKDLRKILKKIASLAHSPRPEGCKKLSTQEKYRIRQGKYRILYAIEGEKLVVYVVKIAHRKNAYR